MLSEFVDLFVGVCVLADIIDAFGVESLVITDDPATGVIGVPGPASVVRVGVLPVTSFKQCRTAFSAVGS
jgi:hypothetical protein